MNISGVIQIIGVGGFLLGILGIVIFVSNVSQGRSGRSGVLLAVLGFVLGILFTIVANGILVVEPTRTAVIVNVLTGELEDPARPPGTSIVIPGIQTPIVYPTDEQEYTMSGIPNEGRVQGDDAVQALTRDGQQVFMDVTVLYRIERENANTVHLKWQQRYEPQFIRPQLRAIVRDVVSQFQAEAIYGTGTVSSQDSSGDTVLAGREEMQREVEDRLREVMAEAGLTLSDVLIRNIQFNQEFANSIELKQIAEQELERAKTVAQRVEEEARGRANASIASAEGQAEAKLIQARADAEALRLISEQIAANPNLIQYEYIQNLSDNVEMVLLPANSPFLFDANSFTDVGQDFEAPAVPEVIAPTAEPETDDGN